MKKAILIIILLSPLFGSAQEYNFNLLTKYVSANGFSKESIVYSNMTNDSYFLKLFKHKKKYKAFIVDLKTLKQHYFKVTESFNDKNEVFFQFDYRNTQSFTIPYNARNFSFDFKKKKTDSTFAIVEMTTLKYKTEIIGKANLKIKKHPSNLFPLFRFSNLHPFEYNSMMTYPETGLVEKYTRVYEKDTITIKLDFYKDVNFQLKAKK